MNPRRENNLIVVDYNGEEVAARDPISLCRLLQRFGMPMVQIAFLYTRLKTDSALIA